MVIVLVFRVIHRGDGAVLGSWSVWPDCRIVLCVRPCVSKTVRPVRPSTCSLVSGWDGWLKKKSPLILLDTMGALGVWPPSYGWRLVLFLWWPDLDWLVTEITNMCMSDLRTLPKVYHPLDDHMGAFIVPPLSQTMPRPSLLACLSDCIIQEPGRFADFIRFVIWTL